MALPHTDPTDFTDFFVGGKSPCLTRIPRISRIFLWVGNLTEARRRFAPKAHTDSTDSTKIIRGIRGLKTCHKLTQIFTNREHLKHLKHLKHPKHLKHRLRN